MIRRALSKYCGGESLKLSDSQVAMHWLNNQELALKQWIRNRVVEILRFTNANQWKYVKTTDMPADLGTRKGATVQDVSMESVWQNGFEWMQRDCASFPTKCYSVIKEDCIKESDNSNEIIDVGNIAG